MNLASVFHFITDRGEIFWVAAAAMAVGVALIAAAWMWQVARWRRGKRRTAAAEAERSSAASRVVAQRAAAPQHAGLRGVQPARTGRGPRVRTRPEAVATGGDAVASAAATGADGSWDGPALVDLLQRLQGAADRLEKMSDDAGPAAESRPESALKDEPSEVEYVFKASRC